MFSVKAAIQSTQKPQQLDDLSPKQLQALLDKYKKEGALALSKARAYVRHKSPYQSRVIFGLIPIQTIGLGTLGVTDAMVLYYDPIWYVEIQQLEPDFAQAKGSTDFERKMDAIRGFAAAHEGWHIMRGMRRLVRMEQALVAEGLDAETAKALTNIGFDIAINYDLGQMEYTVPWWVYTPESFDFEPGLTGEQYTRLLIDKQKEQKKLAEKIHESMEGLPQAPGMPGSEGEGEANGNGVSKKKGVVGAGGCGGCANNNIGQDFEDKLNKEYGRSEADKKRIRKQAIQSAREHAAAGRGYMPSDAEMELDKERPPGVVPWRMRMAHIIRTTTGKIVAGKADFSLARPSRRSYTVGMWRPGLVDHQIEVVFIEDSSGSMGMEQLLHSRAEGCSLMEQMGITTVWFLDADADVAMAPKRVGVRELATMPVHGRGGTNFAPALKAVQKLVPKPDLAVYFTDGDGYAPDEPPRGMEVIWCLVPTYHAVRPARWGHLIVVDDNQNVIDRFE